MAVIGRVAAVPLHLVPEVVPDRRQGSRSPVYTVYRQAQLHLSIHPSSLNHPNPNPHSWAPLHTARANHSNPSTRSRLGRQLRSFSLGYLKTQDSGPSTPKHQCILRSQHRAIPKPTPRHCQGTSLLPMPKAAVLDSSETHKLCGL